MKFLGIGVPPKLMLEQLISSIKILERHLGLHHKIIIQCLLDMKVRIQQPVGTIKENKSVKTADSKLKKMNN